MGKEGISTREATDQAVLKDEELVQRILNGQKELFELIIRRHNPRLYRISRSIVKDDAEAEEVMQESYVRAYEKLSDFRGEAAFSTWLIRILINEARALVRKRSRWSNGGEVQEELQVLDLTEGVESGFTLSPEETTMNKELNKMLEKAMEQLPGGYRDVFVMREVEGLSIAETAACLELSEDNVKIRLHRAKEMMRDLLMASYQDADIYPFHRVRCDRVVRRVFERI